MVNLTSFWKPEICGQTELPDRSLLIGQKLVEWKLPILNAIFWEIFKQCVMLWNLLDKQSPGFFPHKLLSSVCVCLHPTQSWIQGGWINDKSVFGQPFFLSFLLLSPIFCQQSWIKPIGNDRTSSKSLQMDDFNDIFGTYNLVKDMLVK